MRTLTAEEFAEVKSLSMEAAKCLEPLATIPVPFVCIIALPDGNVIRTSSCMNYPELNMHMRKEISEYLRFLLDRIDKN